MTEQIKFIILMLMSLPSADKIYEQLITPNRRGVYASLGRWYNNALFARDNLVTARILLHQKPDLALEVIRTCVWFQGQKNRPMTGEEPGKIFHEYRNLRDWKGNSPDRLRAQLWSYLWNRSTAQLLTYYNFDNTASFVLLVDAYCRRHGNKILDQYFERATGNRITLRDSVSESLQWIHAKMDPETGIFWFSRKTPWELLNQVWKDSPTAYINENGKLPAFTKPTAYLITQILCSEALLKAPNLLADHDILLLKKLHNAEKKAIPAIMQFWLEDQQYFSPIATKNKKSIQFFSCPSSDVIWLFVSDTMRLLPDYQSIMTDSIRHIFGSDFLTDAGIRCRSLNHQPHLPVVDYHGSYTVWPFDAYMLWAGLRKQGFMRLAQKIEDRANKAIHHAGNYTEYFVADHNGNVFYNLSPISRQPVKKVYKLQFAPESNQAWTMAAYIKMLDTNMQISAVHKTTWKKKLDQSLADALPPIKKAGDAAHYYNERFGFFKLLWYYRRDTLKTLFSRYTNKG